MKSLALVLLLVVTSAGAWADASSVDDARRLYLAGRQAFGAGRLLVATESFEAAYRLQPHPALLWNLGQTYRRRFMLEQRVELLASAVDAYRRYLTDSAEGENRDEATRLLAELTPMLARLAPERIGATPPLPAPPPPPKTELMIVADAERATVSLDGAAASATPLLAEVEPGEHHAHVAGPGYVATELKLQAVAGRLVTSEAHLAPLPASVELRGPSGARLFVDQQAAGRLPRGPVELPPGAHELTLLERGHQPWALSFDVERGAHKQLAARLSKTTQRRAVPVLAVFAGATGAAAIVLGALWGKKQSDADGWVAPLQNGQLTLAQYAAYQDDKSKRDQYRVATLVTIGVAAGVALGAVALYRFDDPALPEARR